LNPVPFLTLEKNREEEMLNKRLQELEEEGMPIRVGIVGAGRMGTGVACQISRMKGMRAVILSDIELERATAAFRQCGVKAKEILVTDDLEKARLAIFEGRVVATRRKEIVPRVPVDAIVEATGVPEVGALVALEGIQNRKHIVMLNVETDVVIGPLLKRMADAANVVYTLTIGDEPGAISELYDFVVSLGMEVVCAGKSPFKPIVREETPETLSKEASLLGLNPRMLCSFRDGSKTDIEMAAVANGTGLVPDVPGMHGPQATLADLPKVFSLKGQGGILRRNGVVDFATSFLDREGNTDRARSVAPGVFVVFTTDHSQIRKDLEWLLMGKGPNYCLYRPYHLVGIETPISIGRAAVYGDASLAPLGGMVAEVATVAKKDLKAGEILDGIGGFTVHGMIHRADEARKENLLPLGLTHGARLKRTIKKGHLIRYDQVEVEDSILLQLRKVQDATFA
jgi:predicted homoserine dehydrogenase-like protein